ncbi:hypothetical protein BT63DRAFT_74879 [Microthyrium microscopicum]|uniref:Uncharacterized protein n=1 Tax=Microthyrium microscopicum TaxID=703497 RepID=A0A6A6U479_9PEZI|nr:hypothetical protein BT63DRAFT_74879 [Microthyrium microscopicum]
MSSDPKSDTTDEVIQLLEQLSCSSPQSSDSPAEAVLSSGLLKSLKSSLVPEPLPIGGLQAYEFAEHKHLGDSVTLKGTDVISFKARNNIYITYGQINGLAGDFYGTMAPICNGTTVEDQEHRFIYAWWTLFNKDSDAHSVLNLLKTEVDSFENAKTQQELGQGVFSETYKPTGPWSAQWTTLRTLLTTSSYWRLGAVNLDHFGEDAGTAYNTGHRVALKLAATASPNADAVLSPKDRGDILKTAYTMNAFADHFLQDRFASGHLRTPRRKLLDTLDVQTLQLASLDEQAKNLC